MKINKTNAARLLDKAKIIYELIPYEVDENDLSAVHVAASLGENIEQVFKTLVLHGDKNGYFVCVGRTSLTAPSNVGVWTSVDGISWEYHQQISLSSITTNSFEYHDGKFYLFSGSGVWTANA